MSYQICIECNQRYDLDDIIYYCGCSGLIEVKHELDASLRWHDKVSCHPGLDPGSSKSGVWRFHQAVLPIAKPEQIISHPEGHTRLYQRDILSKWAGVNELYLKHEGENPTGSFKDRGMTVAVTQANRLGQKSLACASTGNTSASLAAYGAQAGIKTLVFLPKGKVAPSKLGQAIAYGAELKEIEGDFDAAMAQVLEASKEQGLYLVNSINPFRIEGQKTIMWELFEQLDWQVPDWVIVPGGNLGNTSAFGKAIGEAFEAGWIKSKPRIAVIQAEGANPFYQSFKQGFKDLKPVKANTRATAINIGQPVNYSKAKRIIKALNGLVEEVSDAQIKEAKAQIDQSGIGCEPASAATLAGLKKLVLAKEIKAKESVALILTGNILKDPVMD
ncbi:MAG: threonine synthase [Deltaproteobacteria bacterium]|nr:threonine synthase [Deltaproteobacteria bacterium]